ncbi:MAG TPA: hypothetical protein VK197_01590 [Verrucomicrobiae bacterium]|nr:hypothetical protein [Verrucomicrobiae bacterium]
MSDPTAHTTVEDIERLDLSPAAKRGALLLREAHPQLRFLSGRRTLARQARAMARNIVESADRAWIEKVYVAAAPLQAWVSEHSEATMVEALAAGLEETLVAMSPAQQARVSKHLSGDAFDLRPVHGETEAAIRETIGGLPGLVKFIDREGGLERWHVQF